MVKGVVGFAGVSWVNGKYSLHTSTMAKIGVNIEAPGHAHFITVKLPQGIAEKEDIIKYLLSHSEFQASEIQEFLKSKQAKKATYTTNPVLKQSGIDKLKIT